MNSTVAPGRQTSSTHSRSGAAASSTGDDPDLKPTKLRNQRHSHYRPLTPPTAVTIRLALRTSCVVLLALFALTFLRISIENAFVVTDGGTTLGSTTGQQDRHLNGTSSLRRGDSAALPPPKEGTYYRGQVYPPKLFEPIEMEEGDSSATTVFTFFDEEGVNKPWNEKDETLERFFGSLRKTGYMVRSIAHASARFNST